VIRQGPLGQTNPVKNMTKSVKKRGHEHGKNKQRGDPLKSSSDAMWMMTAICMA
jgi:hypothetical protein